MAQNYRNRDLLPDFLNKKTNIEGDDLSGFADSLLSEMGFVPESLASRKSDIPWGTSSGVSESGTSFGKRPTRDPKDFTFNSKNTSNEKSSERTLDGFADNLLADMGFGDKGVHSPPHKREAKRGSSFEDFDFEADRDKGIHSPLRERGAKRGRSFEDFDFGAVDFTNRSEGSAAYASKPVTSHEPATTSVKSAHAPKSVVANDPRSSDVDYSYAPYSAMIDLPEIKDRPPTVAGIERQKSRFTPAPPRTGYGEHARKTQDRGIEPIKSEFAARTPLLQATDVETSERYKFSYMGNTSLSSISSPSAANREPVYKAHPAASSEPLTARKESLEKSYEFTYKDYVDKYILSDATPSSNDDTIEDAPTLDAAVLPKKLFWRTHAKHIRFTLIVLAIILFETLLMGWLASLGIDFPWQ